MKLPGSLHRSDYIISSLDDGGREVAYLVHVVKEMIIVGKPASVYKIVTAQSYKHRYSNNMKQL